MNDESLQKLFDGVSAITKGHSPEEVVGVLMAIIALHINRSSYPTHWWGFIISRCVGQLNEMVTQEGEWWEVSVERHAQEPLTRYLQ